MVRIQRHQIDSVENRIRLGLERSINKIPERMALAHQSWEAARNLQLLLHGIVRYASLVPSTSKSVHFSVRVASDCGACLFNCGAGSIPTPINGVTPQFEAVSDNSVLNASEWILSFYLSLMGRKQSNLAELSNIPSDMIRRSTTRDPEFRYIFIEALQAMHRGSPEAGNLLVRSLEGTDPAALSDADWILYHDVHQINVLGKFLSCDSKSFEAALIKAVQVHKEYWSISDERRNDSLGFLSIPLIAIAALAYDSGFRFDIDSEYLPMWLVAGE